MSWLDLTNVIANILIGITAVVALWFSMKALRKSEWDSSMTTSPSLVLRPTSIWVGTRDKEEYHGYGVVEPGRAIRADSDPFEIAFSIEFECFNAGRGVAFNISQPASSGMTVSASRSNKVPLYQTLEDEPFRVSLSEFKKFKGWYNAADDEIPVYLEILYTNDQNNVYCKSTWQAKIKPFERDGNDLKTREIRLLDRKGKIEYSVKPYQV